MTFDRDDLIAYLNGTGSAELTAAVDAQLQTDDALAQRLLALDPAAPLVSDAFAQITPPPMMRTAQGNTAWMPVALVASTALAAVAIWSVLPAPGQAWHRQVAEYQVLYTPQTISMISVSDTALSQQFDVLRTELSIDFDASTLSDIAGLGLLRAQLLGFDGAPLGQIVFADPAGRPIALCLMEGSGETAPSHATLAGLNTVSWSNGTHQFLLVGDVPEGDLQTWAAAVQNAV